MKSVDRLREWANGLHGVYINQVDHSITVTTGWDAPPDMDSVSLRAHINGILDTIEQEVEGMRDFCERLDDAATKREDVTIWGVDYTPLPLDAEDVPIHVGDVMEWPDHSTAEVVGIGDGTFFYVEDGEDAAEWSCAFNKIHHHAPTVEDVLREFAAQVTNGQRIHGAIEIEQAVAEYAAKLQLKEG